MDRPQPGLTLEIQIHHGQDLPIEHSFNSVFHRTVKIGRRAGDLLRITAAAPKRVRARITLSSSTATLTDLGTEGGITVNHEVMRERVLQLHDRIGIGGTVLVVSACTVVQTAAPKEPAEVRQMANTSALERSRLNAKLAELDRRDLAAVEALVDSLRRENRAERRRGKPSERRPKVKSAPPVALNEVLLPEPPSAPSPFDAPQPVPAAPSPHDGAVPFAVDPFVDENAVAEPFTPEPPPESPPAELSGGGLVGLPELPFEPSSPPPVSSPRTAAYSNKRRYDTRAIIERMHGPARRRWILAGIAAALCLLWAFVL